MGTSTSSAGAGPSVSFDPPWLDAAEGGINSAYADTPLTPGSMPQDGKDADNDNEGPENNQADTQLPTGPTKAPPSRYKEARGALTGFIRSGSSADLRRGLSSFVKKGLGGAARAASRMRTSAVAASSLGGFLAAARDGKDLGINAWVDSVKQRGLSAQDAALEVVQKLVPTGGSLDEESAKHSMSQAIAHLYEVEPDTDIFSLTDDQITNVMAYTVAFDVYHHVQRELGRVFEKLKYTPRIIQERLAQALDYVLVVVNRSMEKVRSGNTQRSMREIATAALKDALTVFAEL